MRFKCLKIPPRFISFLGIASRLFLLFFLAFVIVVLVRVFIQGFKSWEYRVASELAIKERMAAFKRRHPEPFCRKLKKTTRVYQHKATGLWLKEPTSCEKQCFGTHKHYIIQNERGRKLELKIPLAFMPHVYIDILQNNREEVRLDDESFRQAKRLVSLANHLPLNKEGRVDAARCPKGAFLLPKNVSISISNARVLNWKRDLAKRVETKDTVTSIIIRFDHGVREDSHRVLYGGYMQSYLRRIEKGTRAKPIMTDYGSRFIPVSPGSGRRDGYYTLPNSWLSPKGNIMHSQCKSRRGRGYSCLFEYAMPENARIIYTLGWRTDTENYWRQLDKQVQELIKSFTVIHNY